MRLIVDTNQADPIRYSYKQLPAKSRPSLVIPHRIWAELLIGRGADARRRALAKFPLLFGMDMAAIFNELAERTEDRIRSFIPIHPGGSREHEILIKTFQHPTAEQRKMAEELRADGAEYRQRVMDNLPRVRKKHRNQESAAKSRGETLAYEEWHCVEDGEHHLFLKSEAPYRRWLIDEVSTDAEHKSRPIAAKSGDAMFDAVWENPILRRFLRLQALVNLGYAQTVWEDPKLNRTVRKNNDDVPDVSLVLYARDGDTILTEDNIRERIHLADVEKSIHVTPWNTWLTAHLDPPGGKSGPMTSK
ncbi:MAG: hypothetical protein H0T51_00320 [Pirellulales bacterium]|nr:hypothetical protein [Pirellulales bacterium]